MPWFAWVWVGCAGPARVDGPREEKEPEDDESIADAPDNGDDDDDDDDDDSSGDALQVGDDESFVPRTWSYNPYDYPTIVSITDLEGLTACSMGDDADVEPGREASQLLVIGNVGFTSDCPEGLYALAPCEDEPYSDVSCIRYRRWDDSGERVVQLDADGGAFQMSRRQSQCVFEIEATFDGTTLTHSFEIPFDEGSAPFCLE